MVLIYTTTVITSMSNNLPSNRAFLYAMDKSMGKFATICFTVTF